MPDRPGCRRRLQRGKWRTTLRCVLHDERGRHGDRSFGQPFHRRTSWGPNVGCEQRGPRRQLFVLRPASAGARDRRRDSRRRRRVKINGASVEVTELVRTTKVERPLVSVVDDDESVRESLPDLLREFGFAVRAFALAEEFW